MIKRLDFKGNNIRIYNDLESCNLVILGDFGERAIICYDDNFFTPYDVYFNYMKILLSYYNDNDQDKDFIKEKIKFEKHLFKDGISEEEIEEMRESFFDHDWIEMKSAETKKNEHDYLLLKLRELRTQKALAFKGQYKTREELYELNDNDGIIESLDNLIYWLERGEDNAKK